MWNVKCEMQWFLVLLRRKYSNLFLCRVNQLEKRFSVAQPSHPFFDKREPLLPPKRASFFQKWEKWHFLLEKVCHVVISRYLCIWKRDERVANSVLVFPECLRSAFALASLSEAKKSTRQCGSRDTAQTRGLWHICLLVFLKVDGTSTWARAKSGNLGENRFL